MASANANLHKAKDAKNDEFYLQCFSEVFNLEVKMIA